MTGGDRPSLPELIRTREVLVCCGSGGVGKTTTAAVLAIEAARLGRNAVVVTIDPAKRLADALGLDELTNAPKEIDGDWPGRVSAMMLDTASTFDELVSQYAEDDEQAERILANRFYRNMTGALSGTQEYMAMEKLYELHAGDDFDLVVVDTPPTRNALDFLDAPNRLTGFLEHRLFRWVIAPTRTYLKAVNVAAQTFLRPISKVVGADVIDDVVAFFQAFEGMEQGFRDRATHVLELLAADETGFVLVASPRGDTVAEATFFAEKLIEADLGVDVLIVNRMFPAFGEGLAEADRRRADSLDGQRLADFYANLADFRTIAAAEASQLSTLVEMVTPAPVVRVPMLASDVHDLAGLALVAEHLVDAG